MREYRYTVDRDGRIFHEGSEITDPATIRFFLLAMQTSADNRSVVMCKGERNTFEAADTLFVVQRLRAGDGPGLELIFAGDYREPLDPSTLEDAGGHLDRRVRRGTFRARFGRLALQQLSPYLLETGGELTLQVASGGYPIRRV